MKAEISELFTKSLCNEMCLRFHIDPSSLINLGSFENLVFRCVQGRSEKILRLTHSSHRETMLIESEIEWLCHLNNSGASVCKPLLFPSSKTVEIIETEETCFTAVLFEKALGNHAGKDDWNSSLFRKWGTELGKLHRLGKTFSPSPTFKRPTWSDSDGQTNFQYIPENEEIIIQKYQQCLEQIDGLQMTTDTYGLIHSDVHQWNFFINNDNETLTIFDFDDCSYHWYISDIAIALYYSLWSIEKTDRKGEKGKTFAKMYLDSFMGGYETENSLEFSNFKHLPLFLQLRELLLYTAFHRAWDLDKAERTQIIESYKHNIVNDIPYIDIDF